jgi:enoyl-CoA hydratase/carnithine racemase
MSKDHYGDLALQRHGPVTVLEIRRGPNNHVDVALIGALADALQDLDADATCRAVVLSSEGKNFCGGADLVAPRGLASGDGSAISPLYEQAIRLFETQKPLIAAIQGAAVGAGLGLAVACDFRVAGDNARFSANFVKLGFHPGFGLSRTLPRLIGAQRAQLMFLTARRVPAGEALEMGLVDAVVPLSGLLPAALALAQEIAENAPLAVVSTRATGRSGLADLVREATAREHAEQVRLMRTEDFREGVKAVAERRTGVFLGR